MNRRKELWGLALIIGSLLFLMLLLPLATAVDFGQDEGFEVMKAFLCAKGYVLYHQIWNDQPPLFTWLLAALFKVLGPTMFVARLLAASFGFMLFAAFYGLVKHRSGLWAGLLAAFFLVCSPAVLLLSVSVMLEVPAFAVALVSVWLLFRWTEASRPGWLVASALALAVALQIKWTAALIVPAMLVEFLPTPIPAPAQSRLRGAFFHALLWGGTAALGFALIGLIGGAGNFLTAWSSHFKAQPVPGLGNPADLRFPLALLGNHAEVYVAAGGGLLWLCWKRRGREVLFPGIFLLTVVGVHAVHRPWWNYYYLHLALPLSWLAGIAAAEVVTWLRPFCSTSPAQSREGGAGGAILLCILLAAAQVRSELRLEQAIKALRQRPKIGDNPIVAAMRRHAAQTHWVYTDEVIYPFHAQLTVPPELAVVMPKRFWSGQITMSDVIDLCRRYQPEQLLLNPSQLGPELLRKR